MFNKYLKIIIPFFILLACIVLFKFYREYIDIQNLKAMIAKNESATISHLIQAFRQTYQKIFSEHEISINNKTLELLPVRTIDQISANFSALMKNKIKIQTVSQRPTNNLHMASKEENKYFDYFKQNPEKTSWMKLNDTDGYTIAKPIYIKKGCLKCHGNKKDVLDVMSEKFDSGYNYKVGEMIGIQIIRYEQSNFAHKLDFIYLRNVIAASITFLSMFVIIILMLRLIVIKEKNYREVLENHNKELALLTITDKLTGLHNRAHYINTVDNELKRAKRDNKILVFAMFDLDCFKKYNDTYGHLAGDKLLKKLGSVFTRVFNRPSDLCFRLGGEEFLAIYSVEQLEKISIIAEQARIQIENLKAQHIGNEPYKIVTTSIGLSIYDGTQRTEKEKSITSELLYHNADQALYHAKKHGRNQVVIFNAIMD